MRMPGFSAGSSAGPSIAREKRPIIWVSEVCECVGACYLQTWCLGQYCYTVTICDPCAYTTNCQTYAAPVD
jgi:hypothetical protein